MIELASTYDVAGGSAVASTAEDGDKDVGEDADNHHTAGSRNAPVRDSVALQI